jgi:hypothetical protein
MFSAPAKRKPLKTSSHDYFSSSHNYDWCETAFLRITTRDMSEHTCVALARHDVVASKKKVRCRYSR